ncbi:MAG: HEAT repeat domain-containing protein [Verrucomicrobia bacterium]|nr:HEAT repeat domain-containing protein [Verrucomicrobiota bacterium]
MTTFSKQTPCDATPSRIRLSVWLLVLASGLIILVAICLPRPGTTKAHEQPAQPPSDIARNDGLAPSPGDARATRTRLAVGASEPMQKTLAGWVLDLESTNGEVVQAASKALEALGPEAAPAIPQFSRMLNEGRNCNAAAWALAKIGTNALPALIGALSSRNESVRMEAAGVMGWFREEAEAAVPALVECIRDEDRYVRGNAIAALQAIPKRPDIAVPALITALADPDASVYENVDTVLRKYALVEPEATIPMLIQAARQEQNPVSIRFRAAEIVRAIAPERAKAEGL